MTTEIPTAVALPLIRDRIERLYMFPSTAGTVDALAGAVLDLVIVVEQLSRQLEER